jgi:hypothetical protein
MRASPGGIRTSPSTQLNIAVLAPMPTANEKTAAAVTSGLLRNIRRDYRRSWTSFSMLLER